MGTTTSTQPDPYASQSSADVNAILQGMTDAVIDRQQQAPLPASLQPGYQSPLPTSLQPRAQQQAQLPTSLQPPAQPQLPDQNYTVTGTGPGTWWRQQQQNQPPIPPQFRQDQQPVPLQPRPQQQFSFYQPPQNSEQPPLNNMPPLWNGNQRGVSGQTKQQFLMGRMMHESQGDPTALNYMARNDPSGRAWNEGHFTATGLLQDTSDTWASGVKWALAEPDRYPMGGDDPRKYSSAGYAPWNTQWQVNSAIYDHMGETPWRERGGPAGNAFRARLGSGFYDSMSEPAQQYAPAQPRSFAEWGRTPQGMGQPGQMPRHTDFGRIFSAVAPLMVGIASLAMRLPLSTAITAYSAMTRAQQNGQREEYQRSRTQFQDQLKEATAQQALESREASDAFSEYGNNNPQGLQQELAKIALKYNDPTMFRMAQQGDLNGIHQLQQRRDLGNQDLTKLHKAAEEEADRQAQDAAVGAMDRQWHDQFVKEKGREPTADEAAIAHNEHIGEAGRAGTKAGAAGAEGKQVYNVLGADGKPTGQQVVRGAQGGWVDANTNQPVQLKQGETPEPLARPGTAKPPPTNPYVVPGGKGEHPDPDQQGDQQQGDQQGTQDGGQDDQGDPQDQDSGQEGKASQAPPGSARQASAPAAAAPAAGAQPGGQDQAGADQPSTQPADPYQVAQAGDDVPPPPTGGTGQERGDARAQAPASGPAMRNLTPSGQEIARQYLRGNDNPMRTVEAKNRAPILDGAEEMQGRLDAIPDNLSGDDVKKAVRNIDPGLGRLLDMMLKNKQGQPTAGRLGQAAGAFWTRMNELAVQADPGWSPQQYASLQQTRNSYGPQQRMGQTLLRSFRLAQLSRALWEDAKDMPAGPVPANELQRWFESGVAGDPKYTKFASDWHNFAIESQAVINGGQPTVTLSRLLLDTLQHGATPPMIRQAIQADLTASLGAIDSAVTGWRQSFPDERNPGTYDQTGYSALYQLHTGNIQTGELGGELPQIGTKEGGKTYLGGDPADQRNWR